jgi:hypothetical protein
MSGETLTIGVLPLGRPTFDVVFAEEMLAGMMADLRASGHRLVGSEELLMTPDATEVAMADIKAENPDRILILQVTFTDAVMTCRIADTFTQPLAIWAVPEPRLGGRLRLNAFCGLNLASHALGLRGRLFSWRYAAPHTSGIEALLAEEPMVCPLIPQKAEADPEYGGALLDGLRGKTIARIGAHPDGFDTCAYDSARLADLTGMTVTGFELSDLFDRARAAPESAASGLRTTLSEDLAGLDDVDQTELDRSLRLKLALDGMKAEGGFDAFAIRCWPETFTEYGGAVCGPASMMGEGRVPCACEADVYGAATQLLLQAASDQPVFLVDLVDLDVAERRHRRGLALRPGADLDGGSGRCRPGDDPHQPQDAAAVRVSAQTGPCDLCPVQPGARPAEPGHRARRDAQARHGLHRHVRRGAVRAPGERTVLARRHRQRARASHGAGLWRSCRGARKLCRCRRLAGGHL